MRKILALLLALLPASALAQNYQATQGSGTTFGTKVVSTVNYPQFLFCDPTTPANCAVVNASGQLSALAQGTVSNASSGVATASTNVPTIAYMYKWNGATWDQYAPNANGQAAMANSSPFTQASDQRVSNANSTVAINISTATTTQLVALSGSTKIYVTHWDVVAGGAGNITLEYGTGTNCGTGTTVLTGAYNLTAQAGISAGSGTGAVIVVPAGNALCALTSAAVQMSGALTYQQF